MNGVLQIHISQGQGRAGGNRSFDRPMQRRRAAEQHREGHVHRAVIERAVTHHERLFVRRLANCRPRTPLTLAKRRELVQARLRNAQHVALLGLIAPNLRRRHARVGIGHLAQLKAPASAGILDQFRQGVRQSAGTHIMDQQNRILVAQGRAGVDDLLATALHLRVVPLHRSEIELR